MLLKPYKAFYGESFLGFSQCFLIWNSSYRSVEEDISKDKLLFFIERNKDTFPRFSALYALQCGPTRTCVLILLSLLFSFYLFTFLLFYCSKQSFILLTLFFFTVLRRISASYLFIFLFLFSLFFRRIEDDARCTNGEKRTPTDDSSLPITKDFIVDKRTCIRRTIT